MDISVDNKVNNLTGNDKYIGLIFMLDGSHTV